MRIVLMVLVLTLVCFEGFAATFIKSEAGDKLVVTEQKEITEVYSPAEIQHEIDGINNDIAVYQTRIDECNVRKAKYDEMLATCAAMDIKPVVIKIDEIEKPIEEPIIEEEHTI